MTEIQFHFNVPDRLAYACRLLRKAMRKVAGLSVLGDPDDMERLNRQLWSFEPTEFLPHVLVSEAGPLAPGWSQAPLWLLTDLSRSPLEHKVLVNLGAAPVNGLERFDRLVEIVSTNQDDRDAARQRWRHYAALGLPIQKFEVPA
jgi:DNA polymerase-3 subunit chi